MGDSDQSRAELLHYLKVQVPHISESSWVDYLYPRSRYLIVNL